ncbi:MAG: hypothetical protein ACE5K9_03495 [Candidatus Methylomirabilales bacterium]
MRDRWFAVGFSLALSVFVTGVVSSAEEASEKLILSLGNDTYLPQGAAEAAGAEVKRDFGDFELTDFSLVILSDISYGSLPWEVQDGLVDFVQEGGSLLITGGPNAYGSGGYQAMATLLPFEIRAEEDWRPVSFKPVIPIQPAHPILQGVTFRTVGTFNDLNPRRGAVEIAQYPGGLRSVRGPGRGRGGGRFPSPLIAEQQVGAGTVVGVAFDVGHEVGSGWADGNRFVQNLLTYLVVRSRLKGHPRDNRSRFSQWQEACDRELSRTLTGGILWERRAAACRRELAKRRFPYMDLVDQWLSKRLEIAGRVDRGELSEEAGELELHKINLEIQTQIERR